MLGFVVQPWQVLNTFRRSHDMSEREFDAHAQDLVHLLSWHASLHELCLDVSHENVHVQTCQGKLLWRNS